MKSKNLFQKMAAQNFRNVCRYNKYGYCKFGDVCRKLHIDELCVVSSCDSRTCDKRHPRDCKYYNNYIRCKFNPCKFAHTEKVDDMKLKEMIVKVDSIEETIKAKVEIETKIKEMDDRLESLQCEIKEIENRLIFNSKTIEKVERFDDFVKSMENKVETFESNLSTLKTVILEKDEHIQKLESKIVGMESVSEEQSLKIEKLVKQMENMSDKPINQITKFKCRKDHKNLIIKEQLLDVRNVFFYVMLKNLWIYTMERNTQIILNVASVKTLLEPEKT